MNGRIVAIDFGEKRCGLAVTDPLQLFGQPLDTVPTSGLLTFLENYFKNEKISAFVIGYPLTLQNTINEIWDAQQKFVEKLKNHFPGIPMYYIDERYTSTMAQHAVKNSGLGRQKRMDKTLVDKISAAILLNDFLELRKNQKKQS